MKIALFDDNFLSNFRLDDGGLALVLKDKTGCMRAVELKPVDRPTLIYKGQVVYLTDEHIQAMSEWEKEQMKKEVADYLTKCTDIGLDFEPNDTKTHFPKPLAGIVHRDNFCRHRYNCIEYIGYHCADRCPLKNKEDTYCTAERVINFINGESKNEEGENNQI